MILGIVVNCGGNTDHHYIGGENWRLPGAPFHDGIGGFASVFVTAAFACKSSKNNMPNTILTSDTDGGTESIAITAGETKNPAKNLPRVVKNVFWRILIFLYVFPARVNSLPQIRFLTSCKALYQSSSSASTSHTITLSSAQRQWLPRLSRWCSRKPVQRAPQAS